MRRKWIWATVVVLVGVGVYAGNVLATQSQAFSSATLAKATFGQVDSHVVAEPGWQEEIKTHGDSDLYVQQNTWDPSACDNKCVPSSGWHTPPRAELRDRDAGHSHVSVRQATIRPARPPHTYSANGTNGFVDIGGGTVHIIRDESGAVAKTIVVQLIPAGAQQAAGRHSGSRQLPILNPQRSEGGDMKRRLSLLTATAAATGTRRASCLCRRHEG